MKLFVFNNKRRNYTEGAFYFCAETLKEAQKDAKEFASIHNMKVNANYKIIWEKNPKEYEIKRGFLPLNRIYKEDDYREK